MSEGRGRTPPGGRPDDADRTGESERVYVDPVFPVKRPDLNELRQAADSDEGGFQFTLREMFVAILLVALVLSVGSYLPGGYGMMEIAGMVGLGLLCYRLALVFFEPSRKILYVAWWVMLGVYLVICVLAVAIGR